MKNKSVTKIYDGLTYIVVVCGLLISFSFINLNMGYISKLLIFIVYMSPTIRFTRISIFVLNKLM